MVSTATETPDLPTEHEEAQKLPRKRVRLGASDWVTANIDPNTCDAPDLESEMNRLKALHSYGILDTDPEECYKRITSMVSRVLNVPLALINFVDLGRTWILASTGVPEGGPREVPRQESFCTHTVLCRNAIFTVQDSNADERFCELPFMKAFKLQFYAGAPLVSPNGSKLGAVCVLDSEARTFSEKEEAFLIDIAATVMDMLEQRRRLLEAEKKLEMLTMVEPNDMEETAEPKEVEDEKVE